MSSVSAQTQSLSHGDVNALTFDYMDSTIEDLDLPLMRSTTTTVSTIMTLNSKKRDGC